jgi:NAD(P)-dependent dehydrogenase (short-subunit alcohol dehydrogenase family)
MMNDPFDLTGQVAFVTGASAGLGRRMAVLLAERGAAVAVAARGADRLTTLVGEITAAGCKAFAVRLDMTEVAGFERAVDAAEAVLGPISILINNAGIAHYQHVAKATADTIEQYDEMLNINLRGPYFLTAEVGRRMIERGQGGRILNISSASGIKPTVGMSAYCASKAALDQLTRTLALEWATHKINVNAICPGHILSDMTREFAASNRGRKFLESFPRKRIGVPEDLDCMVLALVSPKNRFTTGAVVTVDDGFVVS